MTKIKRSQIKTFMDVVPAGGLGSETYALISDGVTTGKINMNPKTTEETYIGEDNATKTVDGYAPEMPIEATAVVGDDVFDFVDGLRIARATLGDAETTIVNVWAYETAVSPGVYPAEQQTVSISIEDFGGDGGTAAKINYTINYVGDPIVGTFDTDDSSFTADQEPI